MALLRILKTFKLSTSLEPESYSFRGRTRFDSIFSSHIFMSCIVQYLFEESSYSRAHTMHAPTTQTITGKFGHLAKLDTFLIRERPCQKVKTFIFQVVHMHNLKCAHALLKLCICSVRSVQMLMTKGTIPRTFHHLAKQS